MDIRVYMDPRRVGMEKGVDGHKGVHGPQKGGHGEGCRWT